MVHHPIEIGKSIGEGAQAVWDDPKGVANTIGNEIKDSWNEQVINGDAKSRGHYFSYLTANVAMSIVGTKGADKLAKTTKLEQLSGATTKKLNEGAAAIHVHTQSALQNLGLDNRLAYPGVGSVKGHGGYQFIERVDGGNGVGTKVRDESGKGIGKGEQVLDKVKTYEQARNKVLDLVGDSGPNSQPYTGTLKSNAGYGQVVGRQSADGKVRWRLDYDPNKGPHINIEDFRNGKGANARKIAVPFEGNESTFKSLLKHLNR
ncbi:hypothetical protein [Priestia flexa]|uniref:hypothetical protein n=1 Tax=Priestia flexa TaxID=86664 RepID=UPI000955204A|nr:hypothetical protein [Priestia flexa]SIR57235.1 hypothetical protein SAMN05880580_1443 [Priestia flexa]